jgi:hypothetical protein
LLVQTTGHRARAAHLANDLRDAAVELLVGDDFGDEPDPFRFPGADLLSGEEQVFELGGTDPGGQQARGDRLGDPHPPLGQGEAGALGRDGDVARHGGDDSAGVTEAVDRTDDHLGALAELGPGEVVHEGIERQWVAVLDPLPGFLQVAAGGERPAGPGEHDHVDGVVDGGEAQCPLQLFVEAGREGVELLGPVEADEGHAVLHLVAQFVQLLGFHRGSASTVLGQALQ